MSNLFEIIYVRIRPANMGWPPEVKTIRDWTWNNSPFVRWAMVSPHHIPPRLIGNASLLLLDWPANEAPIAKAAYEAIRRRKAAAKIVVLKLGGDPWRDSRVPDTTTPTCAEPDENAFGVRSEELGMRELEEIFNRIKETLKVSLPRANVRLDLDSRDLALSDLRKWVEDERLKLIVQKFFPNAKKAQVCSVGGGWSGAKLCRLFIDGGRDVYFLKFSDTEEQYERDFNNHLRAKKWLGQAAVDLKLVPALDEAFEAQRQAFPLQKSALLPLCLLSASSHRTPRETLKDLYRTKSQDFLEKATTRMLKVLATKQNRPKRPRPSAPWTNDPTPDEPFGLKEDIIRNTLATMDDLKAYGPALCQNDPNDWEQLCQRIRAVFGGKLPGWLNNPLPVVVGHTHGDANPRNCLVLPVSPRDMQWIDCGDYSATGRLVSDLAVIERDVKLVMLATEKDAGGFFDLETKRLAEWCSAERDSIGKGIKYRPADAPSTLRGIGSVGRAYRLIGLVRMRASQICGDWDLGGNHYFAALLYWTMDILKYQAIRPTKRLLALYSVSEILKETWRP